MNPKSHQLQIGCLPMNLSAYLEEEEEEEEEEEKSNTTVTSI